MTFRIWLKVYICLQMLLPRTRWHDLRSISALPYRTVFNLAFVTRGVCPAKPELLANVGLIDSHPDLHRHTYGNLANTPAESSIHTTPPLSFIFHDRRITSDYGFYISVLFLSSVYIVHIVCQSTDLSQHWCYLRELHEFLLCLMLLCLCFPFIQPFITPQLPDLSCEPHWRDGALIWVGSGVKYELVACVSMAAILMSVAFCVALFCFCIFFLFLFPAIYSF